MGFHLKIKIINRHVGRKKENKFSSLKISEPACNWPDCFCAWEFWQQSYKWASPPYSPHGFTAPLPKLCATYHPASYEVKAKNAPSWKSAYNNAPSLINFSSCCCPLSKDQLTLSTVHEGKKSTWLTETLTFTPCPQHLQRP